MCTSRVFVSCSRTMSHSHQSLQEHFLNYVYLQASDDDEMDHLHPLVYYEEESESSSSNCDKEAEYLQALADEYINTALSTCTAIDKITLWDRDSDCDGIYSYSKNVACHNVYIYMHGYFLWIKT